MHHKNKCKQNTQTTIIEYRFLHMYRSREGKAMNIRLQELSSDSLRCHKKGKIKPVTS